jgi:hypothetical protein
MDTFIFMVYSLPVLLIKEGLKGGTSDEKRNEAITKVLYSVLTIFILLFISVWLWGNR